MKEHGIREGDRVNVYFENVEYEFNVLVRYTPADTGDCFTVEREDGTQVAIQSYSKMVKVSQ
jgi:hypothetical protein